MGNEQEKGAVGEGREGEKEKEREGWEGRKEERGKEEIRIILS